MSHTESLDKMIGGTVKVVEIHGDEWGSCHECRGLHRLAYIEVQCLDGEIRNVLVGQTVDDQTLIGVTTGMGPRYIHGS